MKLLDWASKLTRRGFLASGATTIAAAAVAGKALLADPSPAAVAEPAGLTAEQSRALLRFTRDLFPHDRLPDSVYEKAIAPLQDEAAKDATRSNSCSPKASRNSTPLPRARGKAFADVSDEKVRVAAIKQIETGAFFAKVYGDTITPLYNQPDHVGEIRLPGPFFRARRISPSRLQRS